MANTEYFPSIHTNGTYHMDLLKQQLDVKEAAQQLKDALQRACPHGRDYPGRAMDYTQARANHQSDWETVDRIHRDADERAEHTQKDQ